MAYKSTIRVVLEIEVPGDQSSNFNFDYYFELKNGATISLQTAECLKVEDLGVRKKPKEITQSMAVIRGLVQEAFGPDIKVKIQTRGGAHYSSNTWFEASLFHFEHVTHYNEIASFNFYPNDSRIGFGHDDNITLADPDLVNKIYSKIRKHIQDGSSYRGTGSEAGVKALQCKGPGVTI